MLKYLSLFSGIGSPEQALKNLGVEFELFGFSEIDKYAIKSYCAVHGVDESLNLGDITKIDIESLPLDIDLITHGSPCQDFSVAGSGKGGDLGSGTRSSLMWNTVAICEHCKPKYVIWENVKNVLSKKHRHNFDKYLEEMERIGYNNFYQVLNAKDYGVPQNRERVFVISIRNDIEKDFKFPEGFDNGIRLKDILEPCVDEKYYINTDRAETLIAKLIEKNELVSTQTPCDSTIANPKALEFANCITARYDAGIQNKGSIGVAACEKTVRAISTPDMINKNQNGRRVKAEDEPMFTLTSMDRHGIIETELDQLGYIDSNSQGNRVYSEEGLACSQIAQGGGIGGPTGLYLVDESKRIGGLFDDEKSKHQAGSVWDVEGLAPTLDTMQGGYRQPCVLTEGENKTVVEKYRIRKLTTRECWRLMGFKDEQFLKAEQVCSNSQLYKQAGNSIVVNVMEEIFKNLI